MEIVEHDQLRSARRDGVEERRDGIEQLEPITSALHGA